MKKIRNRNDIKVFIFEMIWKYKNRHWNDCKKKEKALLKAKIKYRKELER